MDLWLFKMKMSIFAFLCFIFGLFGYDLELMHNHASAGVLDWLGNSDKIAYVEGIREDFFSLTASIPYQTQSILHIKSISNPFINKKIKWIIPAADESSSILYHCDHRSISPKGDKMVFSSKNNIYLCDFRKKDTFIKIIENGKNPEWSSDGKSIVYQRVNKKEAQLVNPEDGQVFVIDNTRGSYTINIYDLSSRKDNEIAGVGQDPKWSLDGAKVIFTAFENIYIATKDGKSIRRLKVPFKAVDYPSFSPDTKSILFLKRSETERMKFENKIYIATGSLEMPSITIIKLPKECDKTVYYPDPPAWSPNGKYIAYSSSYCNGDRIYLMKKDGSILKTLYRGKIWIGLHAFKKKK